MKEEMQKIVDHVWDYFIVQDNNFGMSPRDACGDGGCAYRTPNNDRCAVGLLIEDDEYLPEMEGANCPKDVFDWYDLPKTVEKWFPSNTQGIRYDRGFFPFLSELQQAHDDAALDYVSEGEMILWERELGVWELTGKELMAQKLRDLCDRFSLLCPENVETTNE